ncbi:DUF2813 domain-containing protein [Pasteurella bettyae]|uniref:PF11398 domain protein n=1 Tax=Pasteurella bettyae CCUG 2042 TaxID=1095749 RepID=I3DI76_9PAST|nr:DUF2813 domain-containing protein [Pasteurella bettyae]EIJ71419.1 PF11398 domain protein [Pasteurella bettyae CCUG 2042]SUB21615.1 family proteiny with RecF protein [Pasteurella bettyae]
MYLRQLDISGFRGIKRLSIMLRANMVLIGENSWGKSSLLSALSLILNAENGLYHFTEADFHRSEDMKSITLLFTFSEGNVNEEHDQFDAPVQRLFVPHEDGYKRIYLRVTGELNSQNEVITQYSFLDQLGHCIKLDNIEDIVQKMIQYHPIYRFRDARLNHHKANSQPLKYAECADQTIKEIYAVMELVKYYFVEEQPSQTIMSMDPGKLWDMAQSLCYRLEQDADHSLQKRLIDTIFPLFEYHQKPNEKIIHSERIRPILLLEDLATRLHPRMVAIVWKLTSYLPIQRITTTNSVDLISLVELKSICKLVRYADRTIAYQLKRHDLGKEDLRRLTFHIHHNRSLALFARTWILVEGETEVWILSELAKLLGIDLDIEGIRIVEFAQSGIRPLIKYAKAMGIEWYALTDGDEAGRKYTETVKDMLSEDESVSQRVMTLPKQDIEHFFYTQGFEEVFIRLSHWQPQGEHYPMHKIIQRAIQRTSKPDLAIAISNEIEKRGKESIPFLFKRLFSKVVNLTKTQES